MCARQSIADLSKVVIFFGLEVGIGASVVFGLRGPGRLPNPGLGTTEEEALVGTSVIELVHSVPSFELASAEAST